MVTMTATIVDAFVAARGLRVALGDLGNRYTPTSGATLQSWTIMAWADFTGATYSLSLAYAAVFGDDKDTAVTATRNLGGIGMETSGVREGRIYSSPEFSTTVQKSPNIILGQGPVHLCLRVSQVSGTTRTTTLYLNGAPLFDDTQTVAAPTPGVLFHGEQSVFGGMAPPDRYANVKLYESALSEDEISGIYLEERAELGLPAPKMMVMGSFDSLTSFSDAPYWDTIAAPSLIPGVFGMLDAVGGSRHSGGADLAGTGSDYNSPERQGLRRRALKYAAKHFQEAVWLCGFGTNDLVGGPMDPNTTTWQAGRDTIDGMIAADIASVPAEYRANIKPVVVTVIPNSNWIATGADANSEAREVARLAYNQDCRDNFASRGYDAVIDPASHNPDGFASMEAASIDAGSNGENSMYLSDGIHYSGSGGAEMAAAVHIPFLTARMGAL